MPHLVSKKKHIQYIYIYTQYKSQAWPFNAMREHMAFGSMFALAAQKLCYNNRHTATRTKCNLKKLNFSFSCLVPDRLVGISYASQQGIKSSILTLATLRTARPTANAHKKSFVAHLWELLAQASPKRGTSEVSTRHRDKQALVLVRAQNKENLWEDAFFDSVLSLKSDAGSFIISTLWRSQYQTNISMCYTHKS